MSNTDTKSLLPHTAVYGINVDAEATQLRFQAAIAMIDDYFGPDYSKKNPHLVAAVLNSMTTAATLTSDQE